MQAVEHRKLAETPYPEHPAPSADVCAQAVARLSELHGAVRRRKNVEVAGCGGVSQVLDAVVRTILSQNTTNANSSRAMRSFVQRFGGDYEKVARANVQDIAASIACGGLGNIKAKRIKDLLADLKARRGDISLEYLRDLADEKIVEELCLFKGVGTKTASCVLLFCLGRDSFAVDTHVYRIARALGWVPARASRDMAYAHLDARVPSHLKYALHVLLVRHGKSCPECAANQRPQQRPLGPCPLLPIRRANKN